MRTNWVCSTSNPHGNLLPRELSFYIKNKAKEEKAGALKVDGHLLCLVCLKEYTGDVCPHCKHTPKNKYTKKKNSLVYQDHIIVYRKAKDTVYALLFNIRMFLSKGQATRKVMLLRKNIYKPDNLYAYVIMGWYYHHFSHTYRLDYINEGENRYWLYEKHEERQWFANTPTILCTYGVEKLRTVPYLKYLVNVPTYAYDIATVFKYPKLIELLQKNYPKLYCYQRGNLTAITKYYDVFKRYGKLFKDVTHINSRVLATVNRYKLTLPDYIVKRLLNFTYVPKHFDVKELKLISRLGEKQQVNFDIYKDYLRQQTEAGIKLTNGVRYDVDWYENHTRVAREKQAAANKKMYAAFKKAMKPYDTKEYKGVYIVAPHDPGDLHDEGDGLHHCVGSYIQRVADGKSIVLFIREQDDKPFITAEIKGTRVLQIYGDRNKKDMIKTKHRTALKTYLEEVTL